jgi:hypothetical protein
MLMPVPPSRDSRATSSLRIDQQPAITSALEPSRSNRRTFTVAHDITAARAHALPALYPAAAAGLPALADPGYEGAGIGILIPVKQPPGGREPDLNTRTRNALQRSLRCLGERGFALLTRPVAHPSPHHRQPQQIGHIARAALVLTHFEHGYIT